MVCFSTCFDDKSGQSSVVLAVPGVSSNHGCDVGSCKFCHFDDVCSRVIGCFHVEHFSFTGVTEFSILWSLNVDEHHEHVGKDHVVFAFDSDASSEVFSQAVHEAFDCVIVVLFVACVMKR